MSQRVEELMHELGLLNRPKKTKMIEGETAARYHWRFLRNCIRNVSQEMSKQDRKDYHVAHGIQFFRKINHILPIKQVRRYYFFMNKISSFIQQFSIFYAYRFFTCVKEMSM